MIFAAAKAWSCFMRFCGAPAFGDLGRNQDSCVLYRSVSFDSTWAHDDHRLTLWERKCVMVDDTRREHSVQVDNRGPQAAEALELLALAFFFFLVCFAVSHFLGFWEVRGGE